MSNLVRVTFMLAVVLLASATNRVAAAEMTFQFVNDTDRALNLKLFSRGESLRHWPAKTKAYSLRPDAAVQQLKIDCVDGEKICWGAWMTVQSVAGPIGQRTVHTSTINAGVGERGMRDCPSCCHACQQGLITPVAALRATSAMGPNVK